MPRVPRCGQLERLCCEQSDTSCSMMLAVLPLGAKYWAGAERRRAGFGDKHFTALHVASANGNRMALDTLIKVGGVSRDEINAQDARGRSPLYVALANRGGGRDHAWEACANLLLECGACICPGPGADSDTKSPLQLALMFEEGCSWLASRKWDLIPQALGAAQGLPVHAVAERAGDDAEAILGQLLAAGADPNVVRQSLQRETALHVAANHRQVRLLLCAPTKAKWQLTDARLNTPLHVFAERGILEAVQLLVEDGAEFGRIALNEQRRSPMEVARGACKAFFEEELARRNKVRQDRLVAEREKQLRLERESAARQLDSLRKLCAELREPVAPVPAQSRAVSAQGPRGAQAEGADAGNGAVSTQALLQKLDDEQQKLAAMFMAEPRSSLLVIGRSGTGKTSVAIQRMVLQETTPQHGCDLNQVFVTMNPVLLGFVKRNFRGFCPQRGAGRTLPTSLLAATKDDFPLFLDTRQWLCLLLRSVFDFLPAGPLAQAATAFLASSAGRAREAHDDESDAPAETAAEGQGGRHEPEQGSAEVDVAVFTFRIWPRMLGFHGKGGSKGAASAKLGGKGQTVERSLSAEAVFAEIMSIIKGSVGAMRSSTGYLSRQEYLELPAKAGAVAGSASIRTELYAFFLKYQEVKSELRCYDLCDVIFAAHSALAAWKTAGPDGGAQELPIHSILVDEVQDCSQVTGIVVCIVDIVGVGRSWSVGLAFASPDGCGGHIRHVLCCRVAPACAAVCAAMSSHSTQHLAPSN